MTTLESVLRSRELANLVEFPHLVMPKDLDNESLQVINDWLEANCRGRFSVRNIRNSYSFRFADKEDYMLFSMRWL